MIRKVKAGWRVVSEKSGRNLGTYKTLAAAKKRLRQVEYFKSHRTRKAARFAAALCYIIL